MKKQVYVIVGHGSCGKSTLTRSLTGLFRRRERPVRIKLRSCEEPVDFSVWIRSSQEDGKTPDNVVTEITNVNENYILLTCRLHTYNVPFEGIDYLKAIDKNFEIAKIVVIGQNVDMTRYNPIYDTWPEITSKVENSWSTPINVLNNTVRPLIDWE